MVYVYAFIILQAQTNALLLGISKKFDDAPVWMNMVQLVFLICEDCVDLHANNTCGSNSKVFGHINDQNYQGNSYLSTYNLGWRNHLNFS